MPSGQQLRNSYDRDHYLVNQYGTNNSYNPSGMTSSQQFTNGDSSNTTSSQYTGTGQAQNSYSSSGNATSKPNSMYETPTQNPEGPSRFSQSSGKYTGQKNSEEEINNPFTPGQYSPTGQTYNFATNMADSQDQKKESQPLTTSTR